MAKFKADQLSELIQAIVEREVDARMKRINEEVAKTINEVLSERYLKHLAETARPRGVGPTMHIADGDDQETEEAPQVLPNPTRGIYRKHPMKHDDEIEDEDAGEPELYAEDLERNDMLSLFFEGTKPLEEIEERVNDGVPLEKIVRAPAGGKKPITEVWKTLAGVKQEQPAQPTRGVDKDALEAREELRLKMLRESLERPAQ